MNACSATLSASTDRDMNEKVFCSSAIFFPCSGTGISSLIYPCFDTGASGLVFVITVAMTITLMSEGRLGRHVALRSAAPPQPFGRADAAMIAR